MKKNKSNLIFIAVIVLIIIVIFLLWPKSSKLTESEIACIAENSKLFVSKTCGHCANQKAILGEYLSSFNLTDCTEQQQECINAEIQYVPTWIINAEKHTGIFQLEELKSLIG